MSSFFTKEMLVVEVKYTDAAKKGRYYTSNPKNSVDTSVTGTYFLGNKSKLDAITQFFKIDSNNAAAIKIIFSKNDIIKYLEEVEKYLGRFKHKFIEFADIKMSQIKNITIEENTLNARLRINDNRIFLSLPKDVESNKIFTYFLYGTITNIVFEKNNDYLIAYPKLDENFYKMFLDDVKLDDLEFEELLVEYYDKYSADGYRVFGMLFGTCADKNNVKITTKTFISAVEAKESRIKNSFSVEITKGYNLGKFITNVYPNDLKFSFIEDAQKNSTEINEQNDSNKSYNFINSNNDGKNLIVYGTPGCGKSYYVQNNLLKKGGYRFDDNGTTCIDAIRTTFYQDYTNTDFVGQIMPVVDGDKVTYEFNPGPFSLVLNKAIQNPDRPVALVIEELNRGNAASIFGDIFQLLDRKNGVSDYNITNVNIQKYLKAQNPNMEFNYIKLPSNLSIFATMNTSDQNIFTLDTAFKRRWEFIKLNNKFKVDHPFKDSFIPGMNYDWEDFVTSINDFILSDKDMLNSEDKMLGVYFVDKDGLRKQSEDVSTEENSRKFAYKVLEYLWDDVAKWSREKWFGDAKSLDDLIDSYVEKSTTNQADEVFADGILKKKDQ